MIMAKVSVKRFYFYSICFVPEVFMMLNGAKPSLFMFNKKCYGFSLAEPENLPLGVGGCASCKIKIKKKFLERGMGDM